MATGTNSLHQNEIVKVESLIVNGNSMSGDELAFLDGVTAGTVTASKAVVVGASKEILGLNTITSASTVNLALNSTSDDKQPRLNSRSFTQATGDSIGFQSKPSQTVTTTGSVQGGQISPRLQDAIAAANVIGLHVDIDLKGTSGDVSGALKVLELELVDAGAGRTITGDVAGATFRSNMGSTISGQCVPLKVFQHETAAGAWDGILKVESALGTQSGTTNTDKTGNAKSGTLIVYAGTTPYHIQLYANS